MAAIYPEILHFLESSGFKKSAAKFRKESACTATPDDPLSLVAVIEHAHRKRNKKSRSIQSIEADEQLKVEVKDFVAKLGVSQAGADERKKKRRTREELTPNHFSGSTDVPEDSDKETGAKKCGDDEPSKMIELFIIVICRKSFQTP